MMGINNLTKGQRLVGLTFNDNVTKYKQACANAIDILLKLEDKTKKEIDIFLDRNERTLAIYDKRVQKITAESFIDVLIKAILTVNIDDESLSEDVKLFLRDDYIVFFMNISHQPYYLFSRDLKYCHPDLNYYKETGLTLFLGSLNGMAVFIGCERTINGRLLRRVI